LGWGLAAVGAGACAGQAASFFYSGRLLARVGIGAERPDAARAGAILAAGTPIAVGSLWGLLYSQGNSLILRFTLGPEATGLFGASYRIVMESQVIPAVLSAAAFPLFSRLGDGRGGDLDGLLRRSRRLAAALLAICVTVAALLCWKAEWTLGFLYGRPEYVATAPLFAALAWVIPVTCMNVMLGDLVYALDGDRHALRIAVAVSVASLAGNLLAIPRWGIQGAAAVTIGSELLFLGLDLAVLRVLVARRRAAG
jgi:O-antigen/teichoic acid export membrane protein